MIFPSCGQTRLLACDLGFLIESFIFLSREIRSSNGVTGFSVFFAEGDMDTINNKKLRSAKRGSKKEKDSTS
jgi:hypothetical protein